MPPETPRSCLAIVLAAGEGTRMRSRLPKVLHALTGRPLIAHVLGAVQSAGGSAVAVVVGPDHDAVADAARRQVPNAQSFVQRERRGTAHAVLAARDAIARGYDDVLVIFADTPLIQAETLARLRAALAQGAAVAVLGFRAQNPKGYGRLVVKDGALTAIREELDASEAERAIDLCNGGLMALAGKSALAILDRIDSNNRKNEFYLTDAVAIAGAMGLSAVAVETTEDDVRGINDKSQLAQAEAILQQRLRQAALDAGVTMTAPETVFLAQDTTFGRDVTVEPYVVFGPGVSVADDAIIRSFSHIEQARIGKGAIVGPYARLRPGADLGENVHVGNFVEVKATTLGAGTKANHLAYLGDASIGPGTNIGAGTITCNYDGYDKHRTEIGANVFVGTNSSLVAPVKIGDGAYIGSGSVITDAVPADALALGRGRQAVKEGWAKRLRDARPPKKR